MNNVLSIYLRVRREPGNTEIIPESKLKFNSLCIYRSATPARQYCVFLDYKIKELYHTFRYI